MDATHLKRALRACTAIASSDAAEERPNLLGVCIVDTQGDLLRFASADGHRALRVSLKTPALEPIAPRGVSLADLDAIERATFVPKGTVPDRATVTFSVSPDGIVFSFAEALCLPALAALKFPREELEAKFALLARKPAERLSHVEWEFRPDYLADFTSIVTRFAPGPKARAWFHWPVDPGDPIGFKMLGDTFTIEYLLMPCTRPLGEPALTA